MAYLSCEMMEPVKAYMDVLSTMFSISSKSVVLVNINGQYRAEKFFAHGNIIWVVNFYYGWFNEPAFAFIITSAGYYFNAVIVFGSINIFRQFIKRCFGDHRVNKIAEIFHRAQF